MSMRRNEETHLLHSSLENLEDIERNEKDGVKKELDKQCSLPDGAIDLTSDGKVFKELVAEGEGELSPQDNMEVSINFKRMYKLNRNYGREKLIEFGTNTNSGQPVKFKLGYGEVASGLEIGIKSMKKGEVSILTVHPDYGYGPRESDVPNNSTLVFEVKLLSWLEEDLSPKETGEIYRRIIRWGSKGPCRVDENSLINIDIKGVNEGRVFDERRRYEYHLGDGCIRDIPLGVELALPYFSVHEKSMLTLSPNFAFGEKGLEKFGIPPNATVQYEVTLRYVNVPIRKEDMCITDKYSCAKLLKEKGNECFQNEKYTGAYRKYLQALEYLSDIVLTRREEDFHDFLKSCYLNLTMCSLKINNPSDTIKWGSKVLKLDPGNKKALYRIGLAYLAMQEPNIAREYFQRVLEVDSGCEAAAKQLFQCDQLEKKVHTSEKQLYSKMFTSIKLKE